MPAHLRCINHIQRYISTRTKSGFLRRVKLAQSRQSTRQDERYLRDLHNELLLCHVEYGTNGEDVGRLLVFASSCACKDASVAGFG